MSHATFVMCATPLWAHCSLCTLFFVPRPMLRRFVCVCVCVCLSGMCVFVAGWLGEWVCERERGHKWVGHVCVTEIV